MAEELAPGEIEIGGARYLIDIANDEREGLFVEVSDSDLNTVLRVFRPFDGSATTLTALVQNIPVEVVSHAIAVAAEELRWRGEV